jgi:hypothetical protein
VIVAAILFFPRENAPPPAGGGPGLALIQPVPGVVTAPPAVARAAPDAEPWLEKASSGDPAEVEYGLERWKPEMVPLPAAPERDEKERGDL